jgi:hypothetical protein
MGKHSPRGVTLGFSMTPQVLLAILVLASQPFHCSEPGSCGAHRHYTDEPPSFGRAVLREGNSAHACDHDSLQFSWGRPASYLSLVAGSKGSMSSKMSSPFICDL